MNRALRLNRRGLMAMTFSVIMLMLVFSIVAVYMLTLLTAGTQMRRAEKATQALYAAEAGLEVALQTRRQGTFGGEVARGRYLVRMTGSEIVALGAVQQGSGVPVMAAVTARAAAGSGIVAGSWREKTRATEFRDLYGQMLEQLNASRDTGAIP